jgi:hypothetical protein
MDTVVQRKYYYTEAEFLVIPCAVLGFNPEILSPEADLGLRPSMQSHSRLCVTTQMDECYRSEDKPSTHLLAITIYTHNGDREKSSGPANLFNI